MKCEYCGGELGPPKIIPSYSREMFVRENLPNPTYVRECKRCRRNYASESEAGSYILMKPIPLPWRTSES